METHYHLADDARRIKRALESWMRSNHLNRNQAFERLSQVLRGREKVSRGSFYYFFANPDVAQDKTRWGLAKFLERVGALEMAEEYARTKNEKATLDQIVSCTPGIAWHTGPDLRVRHYRGAQAESVQEFRGQAPEVVWGGAVMDLHRRALEGQVASAEIVYDGGRWMVSVGPLVRLGEICGCVGVALPLP